MQAVRRLRTKLARRELLTGILVTHHAWPELVEVTQRAGLDYLIVDMEHGCASLAALAELCATGRRLDFPVLVRPAANDAATIRVCADQGPVGFLLAYVQSVEELNIVRDALYVPPRGRRRPGGAANYWVPDFAAETWRREVEDDFVILPQIENQRGLDNATFIAQHELVTALAAGPYDLSADLGVCGQMTHPRLKAALEQLRAAAASAGKETWMIGDAQQLARDGWRLLCIAEPTMLLESALREQLRRAQDACGREGGRST